MSPTNVRKVTTPAKKRRGRPRKTSEERAEGAKKTRIQRNQRNQWVRQRKKDENQPFTTPSRSPSSRQVLSHVLIMSRTPTRKKVPYREPFQNDIDLSPSLAMSHRSTTLLGKEPHTADLNLLPSTFSNLFSKYSSVASRPTPETSDIRSTTLLQRLDPFNHDDGVDENRAVQQDLDLDSPLENDFQDGGFGDDYSAPSTPPSDDDFPSISSQYSGQAEEPPATPKGTVEEESEQASEQDVQDQEHRLDESIVDPGQFPLKPF
jgi:hypothetical protein